MATSAFGPADILIPSLLDLQKWSVIACDQFTSEMEYWDRVAARTSGALSTYHMIFPEAYLNRRSALDAAAEAERVMEQYLSAGIFEQLRSSFVFVERQVSAGIRRGLVGALDLEAYDFRPDAKSKVRASERTVMERLPPRMLIRERAPLELPHAMVLVDDAKNTVLGPLAKKVNSMRKLYDFELMEEGGRIRGFHVPPEMTANVMAALEKLAEREIQIVVGDGNHSLAAAKELWTKLKGTLTPAEAEKHPARYALVELCNVYDGAIDFQPIHRVAFNTDPRKLLEFVKEKLETPKGRQVHCVVSGEVIGSFHVRGRSFGGMLDLLQSYLEDYAAETGGAVDYIHDRDAVLRLTKEPDSVGFLLPGMDKSELFKTVEADGVFPKKSFSIGHARDKRYYLECRKIQP